MHAPPERVRILYVEDNEDACLMMGMLLGQSGVDVLSARTIEEAVHQATSNDFDAYLLGSRFQDGTGLRLCKQLRNITPDIPVVFYSGNARPVDRKRGMDAGASAYLVKPEIDTILPTILQVVSEPGSGPGPDGLNIGVSPFV
jgi:CheY-like chemotaxis protein